MYSQYIIKYFETCKTSLLICDILFNIHFNNILPGNILHEPICNISNICNICNIDR